MSGAFSSLVSARSGCGFKDRFTGKRNLAVFIPNYFSSDFVTDFNFILNLGNPVV
jgi:hypothetical protein